MIEVKNENQKSDVSTENFIKKISIQLYLLSQEVDKLSDDNSKKQIDIVKKKLSKMDKEILKKFEIKLTDSMKESALELISIMQ